MAESPEPCLSFQFQRACPGKWWRNTPSTSLSSFSSPRSTDQSQTVALSARSFQSANGHSDLGYARLFQRTDGRLITAYFYVREAAPLSAAQVERATKAGIVAAGSADTTGKVAEAPPASYGMFGDDPAALLDPEVRAAKDAAAMHRLAAPTAARAEELEHLATVRAAAIGQGASIPRRAAALPKKMFSTWLSLSPWLQHAHLSARRCSSPTRVGSISERPSPQIGEVSYSQMKASPTATDRP